MPRPRFANVGKSLTEADVKAAEVELGVTFPEQYRRFLLETNGGQPDPHAVDKFPINNFCSIGDSGSSDLVYFANLCWDVDIPDDLLAIGSGVFGDTICIGVRGSRLGSVYIHDQEFQTLTLVGESFDTFLDSFYEPGLSDLEDGEDEE